MSSHEAAPSTPWNSTPNHTDGPRPYWVEDGNRAWSEQAEGGLPPIPEGNIDDAFIPTDTNEQTPRSEGEVEVTHDQEDTPEQAEAREIIHGVIKTPVDLAVEQALLDVRVNRRNHAKAEKLIKDKNLDKKIGKAKKKAEDIHKAWAAEDSVNAAKKELSSFKQRELARKKAKYEAKVRKYEKKRNAITSNIGKKAEYAWLHDENRQSESYKRLLSDLDAIEQEVSNRTKIREALADPNLSAELRVLYEQELSQWGGVTEEEFRMSKTDEAKTRYETTKKQEDLNKRVKEQYEDVHTQLVKRTQIAEIAESDPDPLQRQNAQLEMSKWGESIDDFRRRVLGDNLQEFQEWAGEEATQKLQKELVKADQEVDLRKSKLKVYNKALKESQEVHAKSQEITNKIKSTSNKLEKEAFEQELNKLNEKENALKAQITSLRTEIDSWNGVSIEEYEEQLKSMAIAEFNKETKLVGL